MAFCVDLVKRVHELNERVEDIQIEQNAQRVSCWSHIAKKGRVD